MRDKVLWTSEEAVAATGGRCLASWTATGVTLDSRQVAPGDLFVALKGEKDDGHAHVAEAIRRGATAALVERVPPGLETAPLLVVADAFEGLRALARAARERSKARIVAVTGSVGKTGTKEALRHALERQAFTYASAGNLNSEFGAPLALARLPREARYGVFELGMNKPGEIAANTRLVRPHVVIITTVEAVHLEFFPSVAAIAEAKAEIFEGLEPGGVAVLNRDNAHFELLAARARAAGAHVETFGASEACDARLDRVAVKPDCACVAATIHGEKIAYKIGMPGRHWAFNTLAVLVAVRALGGDLGLAALALPALRPAKGRGERRKLDLPGGSVLLVDESYNASPVATRAAI
ncbi:MAG: UDP-N-acetylmuramoylalanyl-D-glutamyl-2, 6-diaminopimelate--D-alanyl-D-alanine ligase, partial [Alphaproteobacteria bacterium]|nr:UDP-N-acetylmuramoylalanyl-D-glutamyl-2, 6-diaminopimelate--D-alanyl-D-alanine ligase [Alphaproteobacteria bacterium]